MLVEMRKINKREMIVAGSRDVADTFGKDHKEVVRAIEGQTDSDGKTKHSGILEELKQGGEHPLEKYFIQSEYMAGNGRTYKEYLMTRDGFTLLVMGFSGEKAMRFKLAYIKQFNAMEEVLKGKLIEREKGIVVRQVLTKALKESQENERMHGHAYSVYTNVVYKAVFGKDAKQLREERGIDRGESLRDCLSQEELNMIQSKEMLVSGLIGCGWGYGQIRDFIMQNNLLTAGAPDGALF